MPAARALWQSRQSAARLPSRGRGSSVSSRPQVSSASSSQATREAIMRARRQGLLTPHVLHQRAAPFSSRPRQRAGSDSSASVASQLRDFKPLSSTPSHAVFEVPPPTPGAGARAARASAAVPSVSVPRQSATAYTPEVGGGMGGGAGHDDGVDSIAGSAVAVSEVTGSVMGSIARDVAASHPRVTPSPPLPAAWGQQQYPAALLTRRSAGSSGWAQSSSPQFRRTASNPFSVGLSDGAASFSSAAVGGASGARNGGPSSGFVPTQSQSLGVNPNAATPPLSDAGLPPAHLNPSRWGSQPSLGSGVPVSARAADDTGSSMFSASDQASQASV